MFGESQGLNLTVANLSTLRKYLVSSDKVNNRRHDATKPGYFASENDIVKEVVKQTRTEELRHPLTFLVEAADDIVNATVDVEDSIRKRLIAWSDMHQALQEISSKVAEEALSRSERLARLREAEPTDETYAQAFRVSVIRVFVEAVLNEFKQHYGQIMRGKYDGELLSNSCAADVREACTAVLKKHVFCSDVVLRIEMRGRTVIHDLMDLFWEGAAVCDENHVKPREFSGKAYCLISKNYCDVFNSEKYLKKYPELYHRLQLVADYVAGMTDTFATNLHKRLKNG
jgi:dGTPase